MIFYLHYILLTSGLSGTSVLLGVFFKAYSDASQAEIGALLMTFPFSSLIIKPLFCSLADRHQAHRVFLIWSLVVLIIGYSPFIAVPYFPDFYMQHPRAAWYFLVVSCYIGNIGLAVAWSLGDSLAVNQAAKTGKPFSRWRLFGTVSWGVYGWIIGQVNEVPYFPKYVPAFLILVGSVLTEIVLLILWNREDFVMFDAHQHQLTELADSKQTNNNNSTDDNEQNMQHPEFEVDCTPSSLGGSLRLTPQAAAAMQELVAADNSLPKARDLEKCARAEQEAADMDKIKHALAINPTPATTNQSSTDKKTLEIEYKQSIAGAELEKPKGNPQIILFRMIMKEDGRLIKYLIFCCMVGFLLSPMNFLFISMEGVCKERGYNFSHLAGCVLISQASIETIAFLAIPWLLAHIKRTVALLFALSVLIARCIFYSFFYYTTDISPYWALVGEWSHGICYAVSISILAEVALVFANECRLFLPEMKQMGFLQHASDKKKMQEEENAIRMALRATMQAIFGGVMDGLGQGVGSLICGLVAEAYSYVRLWQFMTVVATSSAAMYAIVEITKSRWSDNYKPKAGTKAFEIRSISA